MNSCASPLNVKSFFIVCLSPRFSARYMSERTLCHAKVFLKLLHPRHDDKHKCFFGCHVLSASTAEFLILSAILFGSSACRQLKIQKLRVKLPYCETSEMNF